MTVGPLTVATLGALSVLAFAVALWLPSYARARELRRRLAGIATDLPLAVDRGGQRRESGYVQLPSRHGGALGWLDDLIARADLDVSPTELLVGAIVLGAAFGAVSFAVLLLPIVSIVATICGAALPFIWIALEERRRRARFITQLPNTAQLLASLVRGGSTFLQALEHVAQESPEPTRSALALVVREIGIGAAQDDALERLVERFPSDDLTLLVSAVSVHQHVGGSLSAVLDQIAETLRERVRLQGDIRTLTAAQRMSAYVLAGLPVIVAILRWITDPESFALFFTVDYLRIALVVAGIMVVAGSIAMRRIAAIDV